MDYSSYQPRPGVWNWSADFNQVLAVYEAIQLGTKREPIHVDAVAFSPPWWMTISKDASGNVKGQPNLRRKDIPWFAGYLALVAEHFQTFWGIKFASLAPFNEALEGWWVKGGNHEASFWRAVDMKIMLATLKYMRRKLNMQWMQLGGVDSWLKFSNFMMNQAYLKQRVGFDVLTVHGYRTHRTMSLARDIIEFTAVRESARRRGLRVWMSEWGPLSVTGNELDNAVFTARNIAQHINLLGASVWYYWDVMNHPNNVSWGAIHQPMFPWSPVRPRLTRTYWGLLHFTRFIREGAIPLKVPLACASAVVAVYSPAGRRVAIVAANQKAEPVTVWVTLRGFVRTGRRRNTEVATYLTSPTLNFTLTGVRSWKDLTQRYPMSIPGQSIITLSFRNVKPRFKL